GAGGRGLGAALPSWLGQITDAELERVCGAGALARGRDYARSGHVLSLASGDRGRMVLGEVSGSRGVTYSTLVTHVGDVQRGAQWVSRCNCPVAVRCKHAVALILEARASAATGGRSWSDVLSEVLPVAGSAAPGQTQGRLALGIMVEPRPRSLADHTPVSTVVLVPRKESRVGTWITTITWPEIIGPAATGGIPAAHVAVAGSLVRLSASTQGVAGRLDAPRALELGRLGPSVWGVLAAAQRAGVALQGRNPAEEVSLGDPVDIVCDVWRGADGGARARFVVAGSSGAHAVTPIGDPVHGVLLDEASGFTVASTRSPVAGWVGEFLAAGTTLEIPPEEVGDFVRDYLPGLRTVVEIRDVDGLIRVHEPEPEPPVEVSGPYLHLRLEGGGEGRSVD